MSAVHGGRPIIIEVRWNSDGGLLNERIWLDLEALAKRPIKKLDTIEYWSRGAQPIPYRPIPSYSHLANGDHKLVLRYREKDHPELAGRECIWGVAQFVFTDDLSPVSAKWTCATKGVGEDGEAKSWKILVPTSSVRRIAETYVRTAQQQFKQKLLKRSAQCAITGETVRAALEAAHVQDVSDGGPDIPENGLLLRADLHRLFDAGYFSIRSDGAVDSRRDLSGGYKHLLKEARINADDLTRISGYLTKRRPRSP